VVTGYDFIDGPSATPGGFDCVGVNNAIVSALIRLKREGKWFLTLDPCLSSYSTAPMLRASLPAIALKTTFSALLRKVRVNNDLVANNNVSSLL
jgi:hypothetical protein